MISKRDMRRYDFARKLDEKGSHGCRRRIRGKLQFFCWRHGWVFVSSPYMRCPLCDKENRLEVEKR